MKCKVHIGNQVQMIKGFPLSFQQYWIVSLAILEGHWYFSISL